MNDLCATIDLLLPPSLTFGSGVAPQIGRWAKGQGLSKILVVADAFNEARVASLDLPGTVTVFSQVVPEPDIANLEALLAVAAKAKADLLIGFGGGSAMDLAKLAAVLTGSEQTLADIVGAERVHRRNCALAQIPTTAGTGSEAGTRALITDPATGAKLAVQSRHMLADRVIVDPDLTMTVPPRVTAETGIDALAHCVESFTNRKAHPLVDLYAIEGNPPGRSIPRPCGRRWARPGSPGRLVAGGFVRRRLLGPGEYGGRSCRRLSVGNPAPYSAWRSQCRIFPHVLAFNQPAAAERTSAILDALGLRPASDHISVFAASNDFCLSLGIEMRMSRRGVPEEDLPVMAKEAFAIKRLLDNSPRAISEAEILSLYRAAY